MIDDLYKKVYEKLTIRKLTGIFLYIIILALIGLFQAVALGFDFSIYKTFDFYFRIVYRVILIILAFTSTINILFDRTWATNRVQDARRKYLSIVKMKDISFKDFVKEYNRKLKKEAWISKINKRIFKIEKKMETGKHIDRLLKKKEFLSTLITDQYIEEHFNYLNVRYTKIYVSDFTLEDAYSNSDKVKTRSNFNAAVARFSVKKLGTYIFIAILSGSIIYNIAVETGLGFWINMITDLALVVVRIADAAYHTPILVDLEYTNVYLKKTQIMQEYVEWCSNNNLRESKAHKVLSYIQEVEVDTENEETVDKNKDLSTSVR